MTHERAVAGEVLDFRPGADITWEIVRTDGAFETITTVGAGTGGPPVHAHPQAEETYEVLEGAMDVLVGRQWRTLRAGESVVVRRGVPHTVRSHATTGARVRNTHTPSLDYATFFRQFHRLVSTGAVRLPPKHPRSLLYLALLFSAYPDLQQSVKPPQRVFDLLARIARRLGLRLPA